MTTPQPIAKLRYSHEAMVDLIVQNPGISQNDLATLFGYSPAWVSTVMSSDAFRARLAERRAQLVDPEVALTLRERFEALARQSLRVLQEKVSLPSHMVPDQLALRAADLSARSLGLGQAQTPVVITSEERLASLAQRLIALRGGKGEKDDVIDV